MRSKANGLDPSPFATFYLFVIILFATPTPYIMYVVVISSLLSRVLRIHWCALRHVDKTRPFTDAPLPCAAQSPASLLPSESRAQTYNYKRLGNGGLIGKLFIFYFLV